MHSIQRHNAQTATDNHMLMARLDNLEASVAQILNLLQLLASNQASQPLAFPAPTPPLEYPPSLYNPQGPVQAQPSQPTRLPRALAALQPQGRHADGRLQQAMAPMPSLAAVAALRGRARTWVEVADGLRAARAEGQAADGDGGRGDNRVHIHLPQLPGKYSSNMGVLQGGHHQ